MLVSEGFCLAFCVFISIGIFSLKNKPRIEVIHMAQNVRDTAFTFMFNNETYMIQLYNYLTGIEICSTQIRSVRLENKLTKSRLYNDVAYITDDNHLLVMIEHQSTLNENMLFRMLEYYASLVSMFVIKEEGQNKYGSKEMQIPKAEFHIVFNGKGEMDGNSELDLGDIQVKGSITNIHFNNLTHHDPNHSLIAYAKLIELVEDMELHINDAIDQLLEEGYLAEFFGRREIRDMFVEIFSYDQELIEKGIEKNKLATARKALENGLSVGQVVAITDLSQEEVQKVMVAHELG